MNIDLCCQYPFGYEPDGKSKIVGNWKLIVGYFEYKVFLIRNVVNIIV